MIDRVYLGTLLGIDDYYYKGIFEETLIKVQNSTSLGEDITTIVSDDDFLYIGTDGSSIGRVYKMDKLSLDIVANSGIIHSVYATCLDDEHLFVVSQASGIRKYAKSNMTLVATSATTGAGPHTITMDAEFLYTFGNGDKKMRKLRKSDFSVVAESISISESLYPTYSTNYTQRIVQDASYIYLATNGTRSLIKFAKSDLSVVAGMSGNANANAIVLDKTSSSYLYILTPNSISRVIRSTLSVSGKVALYGGRSVVERSGYFYIADSEGGIVKIDKSNMRRVLDSAGYGGDGLFLAIDDNSIYTSGREQKVDKLSVGYNLLGYRRVEK